MRENGERLLRKHFDHVTMVDLPATVEMIADDMRRYIANSVAHRPRRAGAGVRGHGGRDRPHSRLHRPIEKCPFEAWGYAVDSEPAAPTRDSMRGRRVATSRRERMSRLAVTPVPPSTISLGSASWTP
jgi:hypothetical protein